MCQVLLVAGFETTVNLISNAVLSLHRTPGAWDRLVADPTLAGLAVEETLRYDPPVQRTIRVALEDAELGGEMIPKGTWVVALIGGANRDPAVYDRPTEFVIDRFADATTPDHLAFSGGIHYCLGAPLARMEAVIAVRALAERTAPATAARRAEDAALGLGARPGVPGGGRALSDPLRGGPPCRTVPLAAPRSGRRRGRSMMGGWRSCRPTAPTASSCGSPAWTSPTSTWPTPPGSRSTTYAGWPTSSTCSSAPGTPLRAVHLGGAGLTLPRYVAATRPTSWQVVLEPDGPLTELVRRELPLPRRSGIKVREVDGRTGVAALRDDAAQLVVVDAFADARVPGRPGDRGVLRRRRASARRATGCCSSTSPSARRSRGAAGSWPVWARPSARSCSAPSHRRCAAGAGATCSWSPPRPGCPWRRSGPGRARHPRRTGCWVTTWCETASAAARPSPMRTPSGRRLRPRTTGGSAAWATRRADHRARRETGVRRSRGPFGRARTGGIDGSPRRPATAAGRHGGPAPPACAPPRCRCRRGPCRGGRAGVGVPRRTRPRTKWRVAAERFLVALPHLHGRVAAPPVTRRGRARAAPRCTRPAACPDGVRPAQRNDCSKSG